MMNNLHAPNVNSGSSFGNFSNCSQNNYSTNSMNLILENQNQNLKDIKDPVKGLPESQYNIEKILNCIKDIKMLLHSYCLRIFDQSENYLESNKNKTTIDKTTEYNLNLIEVNSFTIIGFCLGESKDNKSYMQT